MSTNDAKKQDDEIASGTVGRYQVGSYSFPFPYKPYSIQLGYMANVFTAIEQRKIAILESPTGTGKTQSLLNGALTWLASARTDEAVGEKRSRQEAPLWGAKKDFQKKRKGRKRANSGAEDQELLLDGDVAKTDASSSSSSGTKSSGSDSDDEEEVPPNRHPKIFYMSRTHSQLTQVCEELRKTIYTSVPFVHVASRSQLCVNAKLKKRAGGNSDKLNELCADAVANPKDPVRGCAFCDKAHIKLLKDHARTRSRTLPEMKELGERLGACPFFASRALLRESEVVFMPYSYMLDTNTRNLLLGDIEDLATADKCACGIEDDVLIFDEGHNIVDAAASAVSASVTAEALGKSICLLEAYAEKYQARLLAKNKQKLREVIAAVSKLLQFVNSKERFAKEVEHAGSEEQHEVFSIAEFVFSAGLDNVNFFSLVQFIRDSDLIRKLHGFAEKVASEQLNTAECASVEEVGVGETAASTHRQLYVLLRFMELFGGALDGSTQLVVVGEGPQRSLRLLSHWPGLALHRLSTRVRSVIVAGGTLGPCELVVRELFSPPSVPATDSMERIIAASYPHVVAATNVRVVTLGVGPCKKRFEFTYAQRSTHDEQLVEVARVIENVVRVVPHGMVVFFTSYAFLERFVALLHSAGLFDKVSAYKRLFMESAATPSEVTLSQYTQWVNGDDSAGPASADPASATLRGGLLLGVMSGKMAEGINFNDHLGRCVVMVGMPYPNPNDVTLSLKTQYLKSQEAHWGVPSSSAGAALEYHHQLCMKTVNQCIGRCIRHINDYAVVILLDSRYCMARTSRSLPQWMQASTVAAQDFGECFRSVRDFFRDKSASKAC